MSPPGDFQYKALISYSRENADTAKWLQRSIEAYRVPGNLANRERLRPIFRDADDLSASPDLSRSLVDAICDSESLIVICSPAAATSTWVNQEIATFKQFRPGGLIVPLIVAGEPGNGNSPNHCFPPALLYDIDEHGNQAGEAREPLAADLRPGGDGRKNARLKVIAALLGVRLDDLIQRDTQRSLRLMTALTSFAFMLALVLGWLSWSAYRASVAADLARGQAEARREESEQLIEFMLGDMRERLEPVGRLDVMDTIAARALSYYEKKQDDLVDPESLSRRSRALQLLGEVNIQRGELEQARLAFETATETTRQLLAQYPQDPDRIFDHSQSVFWVGYIAEQLGQDADALHQFEEYLRLTQRLVEMQPEVKEWQVELLYAYSNLGTLATRDKQWVMAERHFARSAAIAETLVSEDRNEHTLSEAADSYSWLSFVYFSNLELAKAQQYNMLEIGIYRELLTIDSANMIFKERYLTALRTASRIALANGNLAEAEAALQTAQALAGEMFEYEPDNSAVIEQLAKVRRQLGELYLLTQKPAAALVSFESCQSLGTQLYQRDPHHVDWNLEIQAPCDIALARIGYSQGDPGYARTMLEPIRMMSITSAEADIERATIHAQVLVLLGEIALSQDDGVTAQALWLDTRNQLLPIENQLNAEQLMLLAKVHLHLDDRQAARSVLSSLQSAGYLHPQLDRLQALM